MAPSTLRFPDPLVGSWPVIRLKPTDIGPLLGLAALSKLPTLENRERLWQLINDRTTSIFGIVVDQKLVGCSCLCFDKQTTYIDNNNICRSLVRNCYFCGTFVHPNFRRQGIGYSLYAFRLYSALAYDVRPVVVEFLGDGTPSSVHSDTRSGYNFHMRHGFREIGYSTDPDGGKILALTT